MGFDVSVFGDLVFTPPRLKAWRRSKVSSTNFSALAVVFPTRHDFPEATVDEVVAELLVASGHATFGLREDDDGEVFVRGRFLEEAWNERCRQLGALFLSAGKFGGEGEITFVGDEGSDLGFQVILEEGKGTLLPLKGAKLDDALRDAREQS